MYSKISLLHQNDVISKQRKKAYCTRNLLDFSMDHKFRLGGEALGEFQLKIEIKQTTPPLQKSNITMK